jgi:hypothetical protein
MRTRHLVAFEDGTRRWLDLATVDFTFTPDAPRTRRSKRAARAKAAAASAASAAADASEPIAAGRAADLVPRATASPSPMRVRPRASPPESHEADALEFLSFPPL